MKQIIILILLAFSLTANAQLGALKRASKKMQDRLNNKIEEKLNRKVEEKVDEEIDETLDEIFESEDQMDSENGTESDSKEFNFGNMGFMSGPPAHVDPNPKTMSFDMETTIVESKGKKNAQNGVMTTSFAFEKWKTGMLINSIDGKNEANIQIVYDLEAKTMTMVTEDEKSPQAIVMWMQSYEIPEDKNYIANNDFTFEATGNTKMIDGYNCQEYTYKDPETEGLIWMTKDIDIDLYETMQFMNYGFSSKKKKQQKNKAAQIFTDGGFWLESDITTNKGERMISKIKNVKLDAINQAPIDLEGVKITMDMTKMMGNSKN